MENTPENLRMLEIKDRLAEGQARAKLAAALAKAQGEFKAVAKNRAVQIRMKEGGTYRFEYADLEQLISATRPALAANGLAVVQRITEDALTTDLMHADGGVISSRNELPRMGQDIKAYGAAITYLRRYAYGALLCISADDDLDEDGEGAGDDRTPQARSEVSHSPREQAPRETEKKAPRAANKAAEPDALAAPGEVNWVKAKLAAIDGAAERLEALGITNLQTLTKAQFAEAKAELMKG